MKRYAVLLAIFCLAFCQLAFGQGLKFGVGGILAKPADSLVSDVASSIGFGGTSQALILMGNMAIGAQAGYITFGGETIEESGTVNGAPATVKYEYTIAAIPILAQGRIYLGVPSGPRFYLGALAGFHLKTFKWDQTTTVGGQTIKRSFDKNSTEFSFGPAAGIEIDALELSAFYMLVKDLNYFGARIGFNFGVL